MKTTGTQLEIVKKFPKSNVNLILHPTVPVWCRFQVDV